MIDSFNNFYLHNTSKSKSIKLSTDEELKNFHTALKNIQPLDLKIVPIETSIFKNIHEYKIELYPDTLHKYDIDQYSDIVNKYLNKDWYKNIANIQIEPRNANRIHIDNINGILLGVGLGYKSYKAMINQLKYISSKNDATISAKKLWNYLLNDEKLYAAVTLDRVIVIDKQLTTKDINKILKTIKKQVKQTIVYDPQLRTLLS